jgi:hypothetical protein
MRRSKVIQDPLTFVISARIFIAMPCTSRRLQKIFPSGMSYKAWLAHRVGFPMLTLQRVFVVVGVESVDAFRFAQGCTRALHMTKTGKARLAMTFSRVNFIEVAVCRDFFREVGTYVLYFSIVFLSISPRVCSAILISITSASHRALLKSSRTTTRIIFIFSECGAMVYAGTTQPRSRS